MLVPALMLPSSSVSNFGMAVVVVVGVDVMSDATVVIVLNFVITVVSVGI